MNLKINHEHKKFVIKNINKLETKKSFYRFGSLFAALGMATFLSGCSNPIDEQKKISRELYDETIEDNKELMNMYNNGELANSDIEQLYADHLPVDNNFILNLPRNLKTLLLNDTLYINDLNELPNACPYLEELAITNCYSIKNYDFIKELPNLKKFYIMGDLPGVTEDLVNYLNSHGITHNLDEDLININSKLDNIISEIITDDMSDSEKIQRISSYVISHMEYDEAGVTNKSLAVEYNYYPLKYAMEGRGVCINYACLANALYSKANFETYVVENEIHGWNLVNICGKYYYIDLTSVDDFGAISEFLLDNLNIGIYYKSDPNFNNISNHTPLNYMTNIDYKYTLAPDNLINIINEANNEKNFIEKYGSDFAVNFIVCCLIPIALALKPVKKNNKIKESDKK